MVGRLDGFVDGRPVSLLAEGHHIILLVNSFRTLLTLVRSWRIMVTALSSLLRAMKVRFLLRLKRFGHVELYPRPPWPLRLILS